MRLTASAYQRPETGCVRILTIKPNTLSSYLNFRSDKKTFNDPFTGTTAHVSASISVRIFGLSMRSSCNA